MWPWRDFHYSIILDRDKSCFPEFSHLQSIEMNQTDRCAICVFAMTKRALVKLNPCGHLYHKIWWLKHSRIGVNPLCCCTCREVVEECVDVDRMLYARNSAEARRVTVAASKDLRDWKTLAESFGVKYKTAWRWIWGCQVQEEYNSEGFNWSRRQFPDICVGIRFCPYS